ncbi:MAG: hypothetical protein RIM99_02060 [Cyclobacteriaceae bacterium]
MKNGTRNRILTSVLLVGLTYAVFCQSEPNYHRVKVTSSSIVINGKTNVNHFRCRMDQPAINDSIVVKNIWTNLKIEFEGLSLKYSLYDFECGIRAMSNEFLELMKADEEPYLFLQLNAITICPYNDSFDELVVDAEVEILLAGVRRQITIVNGTVRNISSAKLTIEGDKELYMTDFGIEPPTKFLGIVKVTDDIHIQFEIGMEVSAL